MTEAEHIEAAQKAMADLKDHLRAVVKINWAAGNFKVALVTQKHLSDLKSLHAQMGLDLLELKPEVSIRGPGRP
jgi:hypothetical protein